MNTSRPGFGSVGVPLGVLASLLLIATLADPAAAETAAAPQPQAATWTDAAGRTQTVRGLTAAEIQERGLDRYVDMRRVSVTTPKAINRSGVAAAPRAARTGPRPAGTKLAEGCWLHTFGYGSFTGPQLWGQTDVTWCGDGSWITYATSNCYGYADVPSYAYLGCNNYPNYGEGWNLYNVKTQWTLCYLWVPVWGSCALTDYPWEEFQYFPGGSLAWIGGT
jgi:hypothetical protein